MAKTRADLVNKALDYLGVTAVGQTIDPEAYDAVDNVVDPLVKSLAARELVWIPDLSSIPDEIFLQTAVLVADGCKTNFGLAPDEMDKLAVAVVQAEGQLREMVRGRPTFEHQ